MSKDRKQRAGRPKREREIVVLGGSIPVTMGGAGLEAAPQQDTTAPGIIPLKADANEAHRLAEFMGEESSSTGAAPVGGSAIELARMITPDAWISGAAGHGGMAERLGDFVAFNPEGRAIYKRELIDESYSEMLYRVYTVGGGRIGETEQYETRERAAAILAAYEHESYDISPKQRRQLTRLAVGDLYGEMDKIRDKRFRSRGISRGGESRSLGPRFVSAAGEDGARVLREMRLTTTGSQSIERGPTVWTYGDALS